MFQNTGEELHQTIKGYIDSLDEQQRVSTGDYEQRLKQCENCEALQNGVCKYCGCFVIVKAVKKNQRCPWPKQAKWE